jgi:integrase
VSGRRPYGAGTLKPQVNADGSETWVGRYYVDKPGGGRKQKRAVIGPKRREGSKVGLTKGQAEQKFAELRAEKPALIREDELKFAAAADLMFSALVAIEPQTLDTYRRDFDSHLRKPLGDKAMVAVARQDIAAVVAAMVKGYGKRPDGYSAKTIQNVIRLASRVFNYGRDQQPAWCSTNPAEGVELPKVEEGEDVPHLNQAEVPKLLAAINPKSDFAAIDRAMWLTAIMCGLREGELIGLRWRDVKWTAQKISIRKNRTRRHGDRSPKSKASTRDIPMPDIVGGELDRLFQASSFQADDARVFGNPNTGDPISPKALGERLAAAVKRSGVETITCHGLRHTFGVQCARDGVPMRTLQQWMGHKRISTTERYARFARDQREVEMIERAFASLSHSLSHSEPNDDEPSATTVGENGAVEPTGAERPHASQN